MCSIIQKIQDRLFAEQDVEYSKFQGKLMPTVEQEAIIGVRTPILRKLAKEYIKEADIADFLNTLPHQYFDEYQLHAFILSEIKDFEECVAYVEAFLPFVDNWATCDQLSPKVFKKKAEQLLPYIENWIQSDLTYTIRFGIGMLMEHFLDGRFEENYLAKVCGIQSDEYYVNMMIAWYLATALAKQYEATLPILEKKQLSQWVQNKTIQKAVESYRISDEQKIYLKTLKIK